MDERLLGGGGGRAGGGDEGGLKGREADFPAAIMRRMVAGE